MPSSSPMKCPRLRAGQNACAKCLQPQEGKRQELQGRHRNQGHRSDWGQFTVFSPPFSPDLTSAQPKPGRNMVVQRESSRKKNSSHSKKVGKIPGLFSLLLLCSLRPRATSRRGWWQQPKCLTTAGATL